MYSCAQRDFTAGCACTHARISVLVSLSQCNGQYNAPCHVQNHHLALVAQQPCTSIAVAVSSSAGYICGYKSGHGLLLTTDVHTCSRKLTHLESALMLL